MRDYEELPADIPQSLKTVIAKSLAKLPENRYQTAVEMREDLQKIKRGENVSASVQTNFDKPIPNSAIPPTEKVTIDSARNFQSETETVVRPVLTFDKNEKPKSSNVWMFATIGLFLIISTIWGVYFFSNGKSDDLNQIKSNEIAEKSSSNTISNSQEATQPSNLNIDISTPEPTPISTPNKSQLNQQANRYIAGIGKVTSSFEDDKKSRKIIYGDLDNDGDDDAVVYFELFPNGGNSYDTYLAVFRNSAGQFQLVTDADVGGKGDRLVALNKIQNGKIYLSLTKYKSEDPDCCPSVKANTSYVLKDNKLVEK